ncbi:MAG: sulfite exporter TauE/SafE family protein [Bacteroidota bacterium]
MDFLPDLAADLSTSDWLWLGFSAVCVGMAKTGLSGIGMLVVPVMASVLGAKPSTGFLLPMLIMADIFAVRYYHRHAEFSYLVKLVPSTITGVFVAVFVGEWINDQQFRQLLSVIILAGVVIMIFRLRKAEIPHNIYFASIAGFLGGFTTMIGNAAGPVMTIYFLAMSLPKNAFIGTAAWFFLCVNLFKVPLHIFFWQTITWETFQMNLWLFPLILVGVIIGLRVTRLIPEGPYRIFLIISTILAALKLFF